MSQFLYVMTLTSFFVAFGVARLLDGWVRQHASRRECPPYALQIAFSILVLVAMIQNFWAMWLWRQVSWTFGTFSIQLFSNLSVVGAAALIHPVGGTSTDMEFHYFDIRKSFFLLCALWILSGGILDNVLFAMSPVETPLPIMNGIRIGAICLFWFLGSTRKPSHHWVGVVFASILQLGWIVMVSNDFNGM